MPTVIYTVVLTLHSWVRWIVLIGGVAALIGMIRPEGTRGTFTGEVAGDSDSTRHGSGHLLPVIAHKRFVDLVNIQFTLGLALYLFLSPYVRAAWSDLGAAMGDPVLRFFGIEHVVGMTLAVSAAHMSLVWRTKIPRSRRWVIGAQLCWLLITLVSIPWPIMAYGRDLFRT